MSSLGNVPKFKNSRRRPIGSTRRRSLSKLSDDVVLGVCGTVGVVASFAATLFYSHACLLPR